MRRKIGTISMIVGAALIVAALSLFIWNQKENQKAQNSVKAVFSQMTEIIRGKEAQAEETVDNEGKVKKDPAVSDSKDSEMTVSMIDGYGYIGCLSIPSQGLELPVMSDWSYPRLRIAPCRYCGSTKTGDLVIAAHNYASHFGPIKNLKPGDKVYFTDMDGAVGEYEVAEVDTLNPTAIEEMTDSGYELTLFTCTYGGQSRVTVRCSLAK